MIRLILVALILSSCSPSPDPWVWRAIDGDTVERCNGAVCDRIRLLGVDTPELHGECRAEVLAARRARDFVEHTLKTAKSVRVDLVKRTHDGQPALDKYGRKLGTVYVDQASLSAILKMSGYARPYDGGKRQPWC